jgi:hypothetical protein
MSALLHGRRDIPTIHALATIRLVNPEWRHPALSGARACRLTVSVSKAELEASWLDQMRIGYRAKKNFVRDLPAS